MSIKAQKKHKQKLNVPVSSQSGNSIIFIETWKELHLLSADIRTQDEREVLAQQEWRHEAHGGRSI